jgi:glycosyltransferase involved in cell wall biosynthesis
MIIALAIHDTVENKRTDITRRCLISLRNTVDLSTVSLYLIDNNSCVETKNLLNGFSETHECTVITNEENIGTAEAINLAWKNRQSGEHCMKIDNDVVWHQKGWVELMQECIERDPSIGILGLKRKDCWETTWHPDPQYKVELKMLPHIAGQKWINVEKVKHVMGTCQFYNSALLDKIGYLYQPGLYGYDDVLASYRSEIAGFINCHLSQIEIDHIDPGETEYQGWKEKHSGKYTAQVIELVNKYINKETTIFYTPSW